MSLGLSQNAAVHNSATCLVSTAVANRYVFPSNLLVDQPAPPHEQLAPSEKLGLDREQLTEEHHETWWLVYTKSHQERRLSEQLMQMGVPHYLPVHQREVVARGRLRLREEPLFKGYLFLNGDDEHRRMALTTNRISTTHKVTEPARLKQELQQISKTIAAGAHLTLEAGYEPGDWVRVKSGPYVGLEGTVLYRKNKTRLLLSVNFLSQGASFEIHESLLERTNPTDRSLPVIEISSGHR